MLTRLASVDSTMELAHAAALAGAPHGTAFVAERQHLACGSARPPVGFGARGPLALGHRPSRSCRRLRGAVAPGGIGHRRGDRGHLALAMPTLQVKWPNDLQAEGRKVAGILCEASWSGAECRWVVVGVGVNVCNPLPAVLIGQAARCDGGCRVHSRAPVLLKCVLPAVTRVSGYAGPLTDPELAAFLRRDALAGRRVRGTGPRRGDRHRRRWFPAGRDPGGQARPVLAGLVLDPA